MTLAKLLADDLGCDGVLPYGTIAQHIEDWLKGVDPEVLAAALGASVETDMFRQMGWDPEGRTAIVLPAKEVEDA